MKNNLYKDFPIGKKVKVYLGVMWYFGFVECYAKEKEWIFVRIKEPVDSEFPKGRCGELAPFYYKDIKPIFN